MTELEMTTQKLDELTRKRSEMIAKLAEYMDEEYEDEDCIYEAELEPRNRIRLEYLDEVIRFTEWLKNNIEEYETGDKKAIHRSKRGFESIVTDIRYLKKEIQEDLRKAEETLEEIESIMAVCDKFRK